MSDVYMITKCKNFLNLQLIARLNDHAALGPRNIDVSGDMAEKIGCLSLNFLKIILTILIASGPCVHFASTKSYEAKNFLTSQRS
jgi:hypothetical protein